MKILQRRNDVDTDNIRSYCIISVRVRWTCVKIKKKYILIYSCETHVLDYV